MVKVDQRHIRSSQSCRRHHARRPSVGRPSLERPPALPVPRPLRAMRSPAPTRATRSLTRVPGDHRQSPSRPPPRVTYLRRSPQSQVTCLDRGCGASCTDHVGFSSPAISGPEIVDGRPSEPTGCNVNFTRCVVWTERFVSAEASTTHNRADPPPLRDESTTTDSSNSTGPTTNFGSFDSPSHAAR